MYYFHTHPIFRHAPISWECSGRVPARYKSQLELMKEIEISGAIGTVAYCASNDRYSTFEFVVTGEPDKMAQRHYEALGIRFTYRGYMRNRRMYMVELNGYEPDPARLSNPVRESNRAAAIEERRRMVDDAVYSLGAEDCFILDKRVSRFELIFQDGKEPPAFMVTGALSGWAKCDGSEGDGAGLIIMHCHAVLDDWE